jgi:hypothetical protein
VRTGRCRSTARALLHDPAINEPLRVGIFEAQLSFKARHHLLGFGLGTNDAQMLPNHSILCHADLAIRRFGPASSTLRDFFAICPWRELITITS